MSTHEHFHSFLQSKINAQILYCTTCGVYRIQNNLLIKPSTFNVKIDTDSLMTFTSIFHQIKNIQPIPKIPLLYSKLRINGINMIKYIANNYELDERIFHSSIMLMDELYTRKNFNEDIQSIAMACLVLVMKFSELSEKAVAIQNTLFSLTSNHNKDNNFYKRIEEKILKAIDYNLNYYTAYDILSILLYNGIVFEDENNKKINQIYLTCILQLNNLVEKSYFLNFSSLQISFSIVFLIRTVFGLELRKDIFKELYGYPFECFETCYNFLRSKMKVEKCHKKSSTDRKPSNSQESVSTNTERI